MDDQHQRQIAHVYWAEQLHEDSMAVVCAVIRTSTGSLESCATVLDGANFPCGPYSFTDEEWHALYSRTAGNWNSQKSVGVRLC